MTRAELFAPARRTTDADDASETTPSHASGVRLADRLPPEPELAPVVALSELTALTAAG